MGEALLSCSPDNDVSSPRWFWQRRGATADSNAVGRGPQPGHHSWTLELALAPMINPVTGEEEPATLMKPKGFTAQVQELCATAVLRFSKEGLSYDHSGKYGGSVASSTMGLDSGV